MARQPGFAVYRNTVRLACVEALAANHPTVVQLVGEAWFGDAAAIFAATHPSRDGVLAGYGEGFAEFLASTSRRRAELVYLPGVARLDRCWTEAHLAADAPRPRGDGTRRPWRRPRARRGAARSASPRRAGSASRRCPPSLIWRRHREALALGDDLPWVGENALLVRPVDAVQWHADRRGHPGVSRPPGQRGVVRRRARGAEAASSGAGLEAWLPALISGRRLHPIESRRHDDDERTIQRLEPRCRFARALDRPRPRAAGQPDRHRRRLLLFGANQGQRLAQRDRQRDRPVPRRIPPAARRSGACRTRGAYAEHLFPILLLLGLVPAWPRWRCSA